MGMDISFRHKPAFSRMPRKPFGTAANTRQRAIPLFEIDAAFLALASDP